MNEAEQVATIERFFDEFNNEGTVETLFCAVADDVRFRLTIEPGTPMSGEFHGKDGFRRYFEAYEETLETPVDGSLTTPDHVTTDILGSGDKVVALGHETIVVTRTGAVRKRSEWATVFTFRDDKIADILVIENTAVISMAYPQPEVGAAAD